MENENRRPLKTRGTKWANALAQWCVKRKISANNISLLSLVFALGAALLILNASGEGRWAYLAVACCIQLRLLCNMLDGMVAISSGAQSRSGDLYNELPDRLADVGILVSIGYALTGQASWAPALGWIAALVAVMTAYIRALGGSMGAKQYFFGPMAKPHRMALLTGACVLEFFFNNTHGWWLLVALWVVIIGGSVTCIRRVACISRELK